MLTIKNLPATCELDAKAMAAVRGGYYGPVPGLYLFSSYENDSSSSTATQTFSQANSLVQSNPTGNGSAVLGGSIAAWNNQQASNSIA